MPESKCSEWRPEECHTRLGDIVSVNGKRMLKIKCRRCSKSAGQDRFHYLPLEV